ncbi:MAG: hypothetical protein ABI977_18215 [Acidobacteriota bacterium]
MKLQRSHAKIINCFLSLALLLAATLANTSVAHADTDYWLKAWTTVGSAGTVDEADTGKIVLQGSTIGFPELLPPTKQQSAFEIGLPLETVTAVVRYNVVATDGLFEGGNFLGMRSRFRDDGNSAQVILRLIEVNIETGASSVVLTLDSNAFTANANYQTQGVSAFIGSRINFHDNAYFIEATLIQKRSSIALFGGRPGISVIQLNRFTPIF